MMLIQTYLVLRSNSKDQAFVLYGVGVCAGILILVHACPVACIVQVCCVKIILIAKEKWSVSGQISSFYLQRLYTSISWHCYYIGLPIGRISCHYPSKLYANKCIQSHSTSLIIPASVLRKLHCIQLKIVHILNRHSVTSQKTLSEVIDRRKYLSDQIRSLLSVWQKISILALSSVGSAVYQGVCQCATTGPAFLNIFW